MKRCPAPRIFIILLWGGVTLCIPAPGSATELKLLEFAGSYQVKISGPIDPSAAERLRTMISEKNDFPSGLLIEGGAGDIVESMAIGRYVRQSMLTVTAGESCSNTCFLIWAAGVHRRARGDIDARVHTPDKDAVHAYLAEMEIPDDIVDNAISGTSTLLSDAAMKMTEHSRRHEQWLHDQCGAQTAQQELDWQAVQALKSMEDSLNAMGMGGNSMYTVSADTQQQAARAQEMSPEYREELKHKRTEISSCRAEVIAAARMDQF